MNRPPLEVADILRQVGKGFIEKSRRWLSWQHVRVLRAIQNCRTAALGGHKDLSFANNRSEQKQLCAMRSYR